MTPTRGFARSPPVNQVPHDPIGAGNVADPSRGRADNVTQVVRPKHPKKDIEDAMRNLEGSGWRFERRKGAKYFRGYCPCGAHIRSVHMSPSDPNYVKNLISWADRACKEEGA
jgi:hypothetical protein